MKKFLAIALVCGLFTATTFAQTATKAAPQKVAVAQTTANAPVTAKAETKHECTPAEMKACKDHGKKTAACCSHDKASAGKSSCCMKGKTEAKAETKETKEITQ